MHSRCFPYRRRQSVTLSVAADIASWCCIVSQASLVARGLPEGIAGILAEVDIDYTLLTQKIVAVRSCQPSTLYSLLHIT